MGEIDYVENYLLHGKYPEEYTKGVKQISKENAETTLRLKLESSKHK